MAAHAATNALSQTPLTQWHAEHGGRLVDFAGWSMPVQYGSIVDEHNATRTGVGMFDVSHMARFKLIGADSGIALDRLLTRKVSLLKPGRIRYALVCNESGGVLDDVLAGCAGEDRYEVVLNASNRDKLWAWFGEHTSGLSVEVTDTTADTAMIAVQGPKAVGMVAEMADTDVTALWYYTGGETKVAGVPCMISRTGYTGEDGFELICEGEQAVELWQALVDAGGVPCGLASRDTLRLEAAMPLYGHELTEERNPLEAGLAFAVDLAGRDGSPRKFIGGDALRQVAASEPSAVRIGLTVEGRRPPREGYTVLADGQPCGVVTSGTTSPTLNKLIGMAYVDREIATNSDTELAIDIRGAATPATRVPLPFYRRA